MSADLVGDAASEMLRNMADDTDSPYREQVIRILTEAVMDCGYSREDAERIAEETLGKFGSGKTNG